jgi:hypothetical protein
MPSARRAGLTATIGLIIVIALLVVSGTLAVSGGGILSGGGRIGIGPDASPSSSPEQGAAASNAPDAGLDPLATLAPDSASDGGGIGAVTDFSCDAIAIRDPEKTRWSITRSAASLHEGNDRLAFVLRRGGKKAKDATTVRARWITPRQARQEFGIDRLSGQRILVVTFEGQVKLPNNSRIETSQLEDEGMSSMRLIEVFVGEDGNVRAVIGVRGDGCARLASPQWRKKKSEKEANVFLDIRPA